MEIFIALCRIVFVWMLNVLITHLLPSPRLLFRLFGSGALMMWYGSQYLRILEWLSIRYTQATDALVLAKHRLKTSYRSDE